METCLSEKKWKNQYIELVRSKPEFILPFVDNRATAEELAYLEKRCLESKEAVLELGSGSGGHLITLALRNPETLCLGVEIRFKRAFRTAEKAEKQGARNLLLLKTDARQVFGLFPKEFFKAVYVNFPDPWDKSGWKKHRLLNPDFFETLYAHLKPGGSFLFKTDHSQYFEEVVAILTKLPTWQIEKISRDYHAECDPALNIMSEFESLFKSQKKPVNFVEVRKV